MSLRRILPILLALAIALSGCGRIKVPDTSVDNPTGPTAPSNPTAPAAPTPTILDRRFSIRYDPEASFNPFVSANLHNDQLLGLVYEGLFCLDDRLRATECLCESYSTEDGVLWKFVIPDGVKLHNGRMLTAEDVAYSLNYARTNNKFSSRLSCVSSVTVSGEEERTVLVKLRFANYMLPELLDTPIVALDTAEEEHPPGTGPYTYTIGETELKRFTGYRNKPEANPNIIHLSQRDVDGLAEAFLTRDIDLLALDPTGLLPMNIPVLHETRVYSTTDFLFLGFNTRRQPLDEPDVRRLLAYLVDRDTICDAIFSSYAEKAPMLLHPALEYYDSAWAAESVYSRQLFNSMADSLGMEDEDEDGFLEYFGDFRLRFIVNDDNSFKVAVAQRIATDMSNMGLDVQLQVLSWKDYNTALKDGTFELYLGETRLKADMDLVPLLGEGGRMNYGGIRDQEYNTYIRELQAAPDLETRTEAARTLCYYILDTTPIVPICYKQYHVLTHVGEITGGAPSQSNVYRDFTSWTFMNVED